MNPSFPYLYHYRHQPLESELFAMERRTLHPDYIDAAPGWFWSNRAVEPGRSPFIVTRLDSLLVADTFDVLLAELPAMPPLSERFIVRCLESDATIGYRERLRLSRLVAEQLPGEASVQNYSCMYGIARLNGRWHFGPLHMRREDARLQHQDKPQQYSTALSSLIARCAVNIVAPTAGARLIDPCCGIGTVLLEARALGIEIVGSDLNPLAVAGARANLQHYGYPASVTICDMRSVTGNYSAAIVDLPYGICSELSDDERLEMLESAHSFTAQALWISSEPLDHWLERAQWHIVDRCTISKGAGFSRYLMRCVSLRASIADSAACNES